MKDTKVDEEFKDIEGKKINKDYIIVIFLYILVIILTILLIFNLINQKKSIIENSKQDNVKKIEQTHTNESLKTNENNIENKVEEKQQPTNNVSQTIDTINRAEQEKDKINNQYDNRYNNEYNLLNQW